MLNTIRNRAGSWIVKVLLMLLVLSFAIWGIGDVFLGGGQNPAVAKVGDTEITATELNEAFNRALTNLQRRLGTDIDRDQAIRLGLLQQTLQDLVRQRLIALEAREMGLAVADDTLREMITENPTFQTGGRFDRSRFEQLLFASGLTEDGFLASLRQDVLRASLTGSLIAPVVAPKALVDAVYRYRNEQRRGHYVLVKKDTITDIPEPTEEDLAAFHEDNQDKFRAPEYRKIAFVIIEPEDLVSEIEVAEEDIEAAYQERIDQYRRPERRTVEQLLASDREQIEAAAERVAEGTSFEDTAAALADAGVSAERLEAIRKGELPAELDEVIFSLQEGEVSQPVESPFGWHLFQVVEIEPEQVTPLAELRDELTQELALAEARDRLPSLANQLDDELAAGATLEDAAATVGLDVQTLPAVDAEGLDPNGVRPEALPEWPEFLRVAFETPEGETSLLEETTAGGYFVLRVDGVQPPRIKDIEEVREELVALWRDEQRRRLARERAEKLLGELEGGISLDELAAQQGLTVTPIEPVKRNAAGTDQGINRAVVQALFATEPGDHADQVVELDGGFAIVGTDEVIPADPAADAEAVARLKQELEADMRIDLLTQFEADLRRRYEVEIDGAAISQLFGLGSAS